MIMVVQASYTKAMEFAPVMATVRKPVDVGFDGGRLASDAVEQRLKIAEWLAACLKYRATRSGCGTNLPT